MSNQQQRTLVAAVTLAVIYVLFGIGIYRAGPTPYLVISAIFILLVTTIVTMIAIHRTGKIESQGAEAVAKHRSKALRILAWCGALGALLKLASLALERLAS